MFQIPVKTITLQNLAQRQRDAAIHLVDVRMPTEFREVHAEGAVNVPLDSLNPSAIDEKFGKADNKPIYVICKSGGRSTKAAQQFLDAGVDRVVNVEGGTDAWIEAGLPVQRGKKAISLERQVRIAAGFLALLGAILGFLVHPYFVGLSAFIGAGLMFAGITDTCGMGMMLSQMPWNQVNE